jgi:hypothetical protein
LKGPHTVTRGEPGRDQAAIAAGGAFHCVPASPTSASAANTRAPSPSTWARGGSMTCASVAVSRGRTCIAGSGRVGGLARRAGRQGIAVIRQPRGAAAPLNRRQRFRGWGCGIRCECPVGRAAVRGADHGWPAGSDLDHDFAHVALGHEGLLRLAQALERVRRCHGRTKRARLDQPHELAEEMWRRHSRPGDRKIA